MFEYIIRTEDPNAHEYRDDVPVIGGTNEGQNEGAARSVPLATPEDRSDIPGSGGRPSGTGDLSGGLPG